MELRHLRYCRDGFLDAPLAAKSTAAAYGRQRSEDELEFRDEIGRLSRKRSMRQQASVLLLAKTDFEEGQNIDLPGYVNTHLKSVVSSEDAGALLQQILWRTISRMA